MADKRITELNLTLDPQASDVFALVNSSETKKVTYGTVRDGIHATYNTSSLVTVSTFNSFTSSIETEVNYLTAATSSYLVSSDTGSLLITSSLSGSSLVFEKGDASTFDIDLSDVFITPSQTGSFVQSAYLSIYSTGSQPLLVSGAAQVVTFTSEWASQGVQLSGSSKIVFEQAGVYEFNFVAQVTNAENAVYDSWFWIKYNGSNFPNSATQITLQPRKTPALPSAQLMSISIIGVALNDNDHIELYWTGENTATALTETAATGVIPETPSIIASIKRVG